MSEPSGGNRFIRPAYGITELFQNLNAIAPHRSTVHDGILGDQRHAAEHSGHNPNSRGIVCAGDTTHDPAHGADMHVMTESVRLSKDDRLLYCIFDGRIYDGPGGTRPFVWRKYTPPPGGSMHTDHAHWSLRQDAHYYDNSRPWQLGDDMPTAKEVVAELLNTKIGIIDDDPHKPQRDFTIRDLLVEIPHQLFAIRSQTQQILTNKKDD